MMDILTSRVYRQEKSSEVMLSILNFAVEYRNGEGGGHMSGVEYLTGLLLRRLMAVTAQYSLTPEDVNLIAQRRACTISGNCWCRRYPAKARQADGRGVRHH